MTSPNSSCAWPTAAPTVGVQGVRQHLPIRIAVEEIDLVGFVVPCDRYVPDSVVKQCTIAEMLRPPGPRPGENDRSRQHSRAVEFRGNHDEIVSLRRTNLIRK